MPITQKHRTLAIGTPLGEDVLLLRSFSTVEALGRPFEYQLELGSEKADIAFQDILGQNVTIRLELPTSGTRYFNGIVSRFGHAGQRGRVFYYHATVVPWLWLLSRASDCRIFQEMTGPEIIRKIFRDRGFTDFRENLAASYRKWEYCVQYRETDFNFVSRLMEQEGIYYYFEHENGKHTLVLCDSVSAHKPFAGYEAVLFRPFDDGVHKKDFIYEWRVEEQLQPGTYELNDFDFKKPKKALATKAQQPGPHAFSDLPLYDYPGEYTEFPEGQQYAQVRLQGLQAQHHVYHGQANARGLCTGSTFKLAEFPVASFNQDYLITQTSYTVRGDAFEADSAAGAGEFCSVRFSALTAATPYRSAPVTPKPIVQGPQTALVVGKAGEEIWTDQFGRVKVKFHWDRYSKADETSSCWIRVSQNWASKKWGTFFLPRIGQEVIVEFLEGDPDRPIVTGCVYNGDAPTPYELPKEATKSTLKSNTSKGGNGFNEIRFEDKKGKEQIFIHGQRDLDVRVRDDIRETNYGNRDIRVGWEKDGATGGDLNTLVRKDVNTHVQGGQFEQVDKQLNQTVKEDVVEDYQKNQTTLVKDVYQLNAKEIVIEGAQIISQKSGRILIQGAQGVHIKGAKVAIEGSAGVSLKVGGNFVSVNPAGVAIKGSMVMINSGGASLPVDPANAVEGPEIQAPFEARRADDGKSGGATKVSASPAAIAKRTLTSQKAPDFVEAKVVTTAPAATAALGGANTGNPISASCSGVKLALVDPESDGDRLANGFTLAIVPASVMGGDTVYVRSKDACSCAGAVVEVASTRVTINSPAKVDGWTTATESSVLLIGMLCRVEPRRIAIRALCGRDSRELCSGELLVYPSDKASFKFSIGELAKKFPQVDGLIRKAAEIYSKISGRKVDPYAGVKIAVGMGTVELEPPDLTLQYDAEWKEAKDWSAFYAFKCSLGVTLKGNFKVDVLVLASAITGIGAPIVALAKRVMKWLGQEDPIIYGALGWSLTGSVSGGCEERPFGGGEISGTGSLALGGDINIREVVEVNVEGSTSVSNTLSAQVSRPSLEVNLELLKWDGVQGTASVKLDTGRLFGTWESGGTAQIIDGAGPLITAGPFKLSFE